MRTLISTVTGQFQGKPTTFTITHGDTSPSDMAKVAYKHLTGKSLSRRRADWMFAGSGSFYYLTLKSAIHGNETLTMMIVGNAENKE